MREIKIEKEVKTKKLKLALFAGLIIASISSIVVVAIQSSHHAVELAQIETEISAFKKENREIEMSVIKNTSLSDLTEEVDELGFAKSVKTIYLDRESPVAKLP